jgi:pimeloyl-ACP methyl ester carboxylesterase
MAPGYPVVVHLVHGTWPFGLFRRSSGTRKAWFENGSAVRKNIEAQAGCPIQFREFQWSGCNSFSARWKAAQQFDRHLDGALKESCDTKHVVIAHSHGGTIAAQTIANRSPSIQGECRIRALVCLATPFVYLSHVHERRARWGVYRFVSAVESIVFALAAIAFVPLLREFSGWAVLAFVILGPVISAIMIALPLLLLWTEPPMEYFGLPAIHPSVRIVVLRATRDEAALAIGLAQTMHVIFERAHWGMMGMRSVAHFYFFCVAWIIFLAVGFVIAKQVVGVFDPWQTWALIFTFSWAIPAYTKPLSS